MGEKVIVRGHVGQPHNPEPVMTVAQHERIVAGLEADARRYVALRAMCCGDGPTDAIAQAWMTGNEQVADVAIDAFLAQTAEG